MLGQPDIESAPAIQIGRGTRLSAVQRMEGAGPDRANRPAARPGDGRHDRRAAREVRVRDLAAPDTEIPVGLVGYGLVVGLDGSGDRAIGRYGGGQTVQSVLNLLPNFGVNVPAEMLRTRNAAAVLVTAEASPYLRPGGRFDVHVASIGDASSLRRGLLWTTPLVSEMGGHMLATVQGALLVSDGRAPRGGGGVETSARMRGAGEDIFSSLLDEKLTETMATRIERGLAASLSRQLRGPGADAAAEDALNPATPPVETQVHVSDTTATRAA